MYLFRNKFKNKIGITSDELVDLLKRFNSQNKVAEELGCSQMTVSRAKIFFGINHDGKIIANLEKSGRQSIKMKSLYASGKIIPYWLGKKMPKDAIEKRVSKMRGKKAWNSGKGIFKISICRICEKQFKHSPRRNRKFCGVLCTAIHMRKIYSDGRLKGRNNPNFGNGKAIEDAHKRGCYRNRKIPNYSRGKRTTYGSVTFRSTWEAAFAEDLDRENIKWEYEKHRFFLSNGKSYTPDFYLPESKTFIEVKGYWTESAKEKFKVFKKEFSQIKLIVKGESWWKTRQTSLEISNSTKIV